MANPFEDQNAHYTVLRNDEDQHSLWPAFAATPDGWVVVHGPGRRDECLAYVREHWLDLRPRGVTEFIAAQTG
ncbi:MbtH family protein [Amycolatopsis mongoliensis]|uniref:MbtH family protein n=1 Tax=Amycolatopsis mongoliensis TaxID=715475 RepID=A0A9Y2NDZ9_9PSEU|nr:MbtH family protein [Amycolatopsis sp. 4-36]WIY02236.1 MbtH family protein [Amycolatopsis sp. 4-36]